MPSRDWSELPEGAKNYYHNEGITAAAYNRWWSKPQQERTEITRRAKSLGYDSGLKFTATETAFRHKTGRRMRPRTSPREAAKEMLRGSKRRDPIRSKIPKLFDFSEFTHVEWEEFLSP